MSEVQPQTVFAEMPMTLFGQEIVKIHQNFFEKLYKENFLGFHWLAGPPTPSLHRDPPAQGWGPLRVTRCLRQQPGPLPPAAFSSPDLLLLLLLLGNGSKMGCPGEKNRFFCTIGILGYLSHFRVFFWLTLPPNNIPPSREMIAHSSRIWG